jgi:hypothetical protein
MYVCTRDATGQVLVHRNVVTTPAAFLEIVAPYREDLVVAVECTFTWSRGCHGSFSRRECPEEHRS